MSSAMLAKMRWIVCGDVLNSAKAASRVAKKLQDQKRFVLLVNPKFKEDDLKGGKDRFKTIKDAQIFAKSNGGPIEVLNLIIHPALGITQVGEAVAAGIEKFWIQPGAESEEIVKYLKESKKEVHLGCVLIES